MAWWLPHFLVAFASTRDLLLCAEHLFVATISSGSTASLEAGQQAQPQARGRGLVGSAAGRQLPCPPFSPSS